MQNQSTQKPLRGFAAMSPERRREVSSKGGLTSQARGTAHQWTVEEARAAGIKGSARYAHGQIQAPENKDLLLH
jgi:general stress protein YciG